MVVDPNVAMGEYTMYTASQIPHIVRTTQAITCGIAEAKLRVVAPDVGGGFGSKLETYAEESICLALARRLNTPIKWIEERSEGYVATIHGRDLYTDMEMAATRDGEAEGRPGQRLVRRGRLPPDRHAGHPDALGLALRRALRHRGLRLRVHQRLHAHHADRRVPRRRAPRGDLRRRAHAWTSWRASSGWTRPSCAARTTSPPRTFPNFTIASGLTVDSGDYPLTHDAMIDGGRLRRVCAASRTQRRASGDTKLIGIGLSSWTEMCGLAPSRVLHALKYVAGGWDAATIEMLPTGTVRVLIGVTPHGQGHVTTFSQIVADQLGVGVEDIEVLHGDTQVVPLGMDTYGSRSLAVGGVAMHYAGEKVLAKARTLAAHQLECSEDDLEFAGGDFTVKGTDKSANIKALAFAAWTAHDLPDGMEPGLTATHLYDPPNFSWPNGAHACVVEVDTETGQRRHPPLRRGGRLRGGHQPAGGRGPGARRRGPGHRRGPLRGGGLRRGGQPPARHDDHLHGPRAAGDPAHGALAAPAPRARPTRSASRASARRARSPRRRPSSTRSSTPCRTSA